jgi:hypothetical protein
MIEIILVDVLIVQDLNALEECPVPYSNNIGINFEFDFPVYLQDIGLINAIETTASLEVTYVDNVIESFPIHTFGNNSVQRIVIDKANVIGSKLNIGQGIIAVSEMNFCAMCIAMGTNMKSQKCIDEENDMTDSIKIIEINNFEGENKDVSLQGWKNGMVVYDGPTTFTKFLAFKDRNVDSLIKNFSVPSDATDILVELDFYQIGNWSMSDSVSIFVDGENISMTLRLDESEYERSGATSLGIHWNSTLVSTASSSLNFLPYVERVHHIKIQVPASTQLYYDGILRIVLKIFTIEEGNVLSGWDNIQLSAIYECGELNSSSKEVSSPSSPPSSTSNPMSTKISSLLSDSPNFPSSTPTISPAPDSKSVSVEPLPSILQVSAKLAFDNPTSKPSTIVSTVAPTSVVTSKGLIVNKLLESVFRGKTTTNRPTTKRN